MTRDDIIRMAREVGMQGMLTDVVTTLDEIERFAHLVAASEREACARVPEEMSRRYCGAWNSALYECAAVIRARSKPNGEQS